MYHQNRNNSGLNPDCFFIWKDVQDDRGKMTKCRSETEKFVT